MAAVTNPHELSSGHPKSTLGLSGLKSRSGQGCAPFWEIKGRIFFLPFPASRGFLCSLAMAASTVFQTSRTGSSKFSLAHVPQPPPHSTPIPLPHSIPHLAERASSRPDPRSAVPPSPLVLW